MGLVLGGEAAGVTQVGTVITVGHTVLLQRALRRKTTVTHRTHEGLLTYKMQNKIIHTCRYGHIRQYTFG